MVKYFRNWENEGEIVVEEPKTIDLYHNYRKLQNEYCSLILSRCYTNEEKTTLRQKVVDALNIALKDLDPQELYFYQFNNYECMFDCDDRAMGYVYRFYFDAADPQRAKEILQGIKRVDAGSTIEAIISLVEREFI